MCKITGASKRAFFSIYTQVKIDDVKKDSIIVFYNKIFLPKMKPFIVNIDQKRTKTSSTPKPALKSLAPETLLK